MFCFFIIFFYLYELLVSLINLAENASCIFHKVFDCIHVVKGDQQDVLWSGTQKNLVFESHGHQVIKLCKRTYMQSNFLI